MATVVHTIEQLVTVRTACARDGRRIGLVPTMGALHAGHLSLIEAAASSDDEVIVSIFVNPLQFGSVDDLFHYPRALEEDVVRASAAGATVVFAPSEEQMFPAGRPVVTIDPGVLGALLEGGFRPGHMRGVATIVAKLFNLTRADRAYFGEKDFEQLTLVRRLAVDLGSGVVIVGMPIVRDEDGLALSSRNRRLDAVERHRATVLYRALQSGAKAVRDGCRTLSELEEAMAEVVAAEPGVVLDYATAREEEGFVAPASLEGPLRLLIAARIGPVRLIDNLAVTR